MGMNIDQQDAVLADKFLTHRISMFDKDMQICLTGIPRKDDPSIDTHAYFPALMACCGFLDLLGSLYKGDAKRSKTSWVVNYCQRFMANPDDYCNDNIVLLFEVVRHGAAHLGVGKGVVIPKYGTDDNKRITWTIDEHPGSPAIRLESDTGVVLKPTLPWCCPYDHRLHAYLPTLQADIRDSVLRTGGYRESVMADHEPLGKFKQAMKDIYPPQLPESNSEQPQNSQLRIRS